MANLCLHIERRNFDGLKSRAQGLLHIFGVGQPLQGQPLRLLTRFRRAIYSAWMFSNIVRFYSFNCSSTRRVRLDSMSIKMPLPLCPDLESSSSGTNLSEQSFEVFLSCASSSILEFGVLNLFCTWFFICWVGDGYFIQNFWALISRRKEHFGPFFAEYQCQLIEEELKAKKTTLRSEKHPKNDFFSKPF